MESREAVAIPAAAAPVLGGGQCHLRDLHQQQTRSDQQVAPQDQHPHSAQQSELGGRQLPEGWHAPCIAALT